MERKKKKVIISKRSLAKANKDVEYCRVKHCCKIYLVTPANISHLPSIIAHKLIEGELPGNMRVTKNNFEHKFNNHCCSIVFSMFGLI